MAKLQLRRAFVTALLALPATARLQDAAESMVDAMVFFGNRLLTPGSTARGGVGVFALLPILEPVPDLIVNQLMSHSPVCVSHTSVGRVSHAELAFLVTIYRARPNTQRAQLLRHVYFPFALFANWSRLLERRWATLELEMVYAEAGVPSLSSQGAFSFALAVALLAAHITRAVSTSFAAGQADHRAHFTRLSIRIGRSVRQSAPHRCT